MVTWKTKTYLMATGFYVCATLVGAMAHAFYLVGLGFVLTVFCWKMSEYCLEQDAIALMNKLEGK